MTIRRVISVLRALAFGVLLVATVGSGGCAKDNPRAHVLSLEGKVRAVDRKSDQIGTVTVTYYSEEHKQEMEGTGDVTPETEILIDGAVATLRDIREGDHVRGEVRVEKVDGKRKQTVIRIHVQRPR